ncbi:MAG: double-strand break repair helicase AddA [Asticcacaulis sp.]|uniref:double-strand break repair helicase AddA n=1 Tax=Asticcacaulis sp. TaxID=1872648 RepID=UPI0039E4496D
MNAQNPNAQNIAADPKASAFLTANAGSGKTSTLVNRVARLLLNGAKPERILCVTYTKAAAAEMQERLFDQLGKWAVRSDEDLRADLERIDESPYDLARARALFAKALETPGGLKIQTLHGFCEKLLRRFPLEAGLSPAFQVLDDLIGSELAAKASADLLTLEAAEYEAVTEARDRLIRKLKVSGFERLLSQFIHQHDDLKAAFEDLRARQDNWMLGIFQSLGLNELTSPEEVIAGYEQSLYWPSIEDLARSMATTEGAYNQKTGAKLLAVIEAHNAGRFDIHDWYKCFYTDKGSFSSHTYSGKASEADKQELHRLAEAVPGVMDRMRAAEIADNTLDALLLFHAFSGIYQDRKGREGALDFQDLINKAKDLLSRGDMATWVLFKLDGGLEHILVDEAQDTSEDQWVIVRALAEDFFSGRGQSSEGQLRTVFAVGDEKQSIYGFQGARPDKFAEARQYFIGRAIAAGQSPRVPELILSYRTLPEILGFVDAVYDAQDLSHALTLDYNHRITHEAFRLKEKGLVELWPLAQPIDAAEADADEADIAPVDAGSRDPAAKRLARQLAATIRSEIETGRVVFSKNGDPRPLHAGDVLILVRKRDALFEHIIRELKISGVPVSGADRLKLGDHIAFQDLRALMRFCLQANDNLSLACVLRSPLCDLTEDDLYALAQGREGPLWGRLLDHAETEGRFADVRVFLLWAREAARHLTAFDFLARVLNRRDGEGRSIKQRFLTRLGDECEDVLEETLALALKGEGIGLNGLSACLDLFEFRAAQIKREQEEGGRSVRVMTVHGSKGLEAPWVILPIGPQHTSASKDDLLMRGEDGSLYLCANGRKGDTAGIGEIRAGKSLKDEQEGLRLLYVALTRARDRLTLCGYAGKRAASKNAAFDPWYDLLVNAFDRVEHSLEAMPLKAPFDDLEQAKTAVIRLFGQRSATLAAEAAIAPPKVILPGFVTQIVAQAEVDLERGRERWAAISQMGDEDREEEERAPSPLDSRNGLGRYRRGNLIHKLFEILPDIATDKRSDVAARYLDRQPDLNGSQRQEMAGAVMAVLTDPRFAEAFGPHSRPEVALAGSLGRSARGDEIMLSGRIDRLVVTDDRVLIIDYKSNRPAPDRAEDAAIAYQRQMAGYVTLLRQIYPQKTVEAALLWTDGPKLTPLSEALVNLRLDEILAR